jgi:hypothetical protein
MSLFFVTAAAGSDDLLEFQSAVDALHQIDPTIDSPPTSGGHDYVVGGARGVDVGFGGTIGISARSGPAGEDPSGRIAFQGLPAQVTCLAVIGNLAAIGAEGTGPAEGMEFMVRVRDDGAAGAADGVSANSFPGISSLCETFVADAATAFPIEEGNVLVHDELP